MSICNSIGVSSELINLWEKINSFFSFCSFPQPFGDDNEKQFIYKEPKVTKLGELTLRLQKLYSKKFGNSDIVHIIKESGRVSPSTSHFTHADIRAELM